MKKLLMLAVLGTLAFPLAPLRAGDEDDDTSSPRAALEALNDFIGHWKGDGAPDQPQPDPNQAWKETVNWTWRFKGDDAWLVMTVNNGKYLQSGELRFLPATKRYQLTATTTDGKQTVYEGVLKDHILTLEHVDPATQEVQRLKMNSAADG
ncbi:MAG: hypothetical protein JO112_18825, partial [Planctomycetes bacterium]|nr:hypothetical protein [Planctomycetota bacterium]